MKHFIFIFYLLFVFCTNAQEIKIKGISFVASHQPISEIYVQPLTTINANYAAVMPFGFIRNVKEPEVLYNSERQWFGETVEGVKQYVDLLQKNDVQVMLKPQIWISHGEYTGHLKMNSEKDWNTLESSYRNFILEFARLAEEKNIPLFCIGTELEQFIVQRPTFWDQLIAEIKEIYSGKLTYAANWDEYTRVPFWSEMDFIGVDAYFPISEEKTPTQNQAQQGWKPWKKELQGISEKYNKPILFTEFGYRNVDFAGKEPWHSGREQKSINNDAQGNLLEALFEEVWQESWMAGGFLWKWHLDYERAGGDENNQFTTQNKPAQLIVQYYYSGK